MLLACCPSRQSACLQAALGGGEDGQWDAANQNGFAPELPAPFVAGGPGGMPAGGGMGGIGGMAGMSVPAGMVLVPAPGAGPFGPFIPVPMDQVLGLPHSRSLASTTILAHLPHT